MLGWPGWVDRRSGVTLCTLGVEIPVVSEERLVRVPHVGRSLDTRERPRLAHRPVLDFRLAMTPQYDYLPGVELKLVTRCPGGYSPAF